MLFDMVRQLPNTVSFGSRLTTSIDGRIYGFRGWETVTGEELVCNEG